MLFLLTIIIELLYLTGKLKNSNDRTLMSLKTKYFVAYGGAIGFFIIYIGILLLILILTLRKDFK